MRKHTVFIFLATICAITAWWATGLQAASRDAEKPKSPEEARKEKRWKALDEDLKDILTHLGKANKDIRTLKSDVNYKRAIPILDEEEKSDGSLVFKKPNLMALNLGKPRSQDAYSDGERWWIVDHRDEQVEIYKVTKSSRQSQEAAFLKFAYGQSARELVAHYDVSLLKEEKVTKEVKTESGAKQEKEFTQYSLEFVPASEDAPARYSAVEIKVINDTWLPHHITLHESEGEIVHEFALRDIKVNTEVKDRVFRYEPPQGYRIVRPGGV